MDTDTQRVSSGPERRRDFLVLVAGSMATIATAAALWPFINSLNPSADVLAAGAPVDIDISHIQTGQQITVLWRNHPIFIANRAPEELKTLQDPDVTADLRDPNSESLQQPKYAVNWHRSIKPEYLGLSAFARIWAAFSGSCPVQGELSVRVGTAAISARAMDRGTTWLGACSRACPRPTNCRSRLTPLSGTPSPASARTLPASISISPRSR